MDFWISDTHFGHANILKYSKRPFASVEEMDEALIERWNAVVGPRDTVHHLGDVSWYRGEKFIEIMKRLNGHRHLILGNHDKLHYDEYHRAGFEIVRDYRRIKVNGQRIVLFHFPIWAWHGKERGAWHLFGHIHNNEEGHHGLMDIAPNSMNVGVDANDFKPVSFDEIREKFSVNIG